MIHLLRQIKKTIILSLINRKWKKHNGHNHTSLGIICNPACITVGRETYGIINAHTFDHNPSDKVGLEIGNFCSIADNVHFLLAGEHDYSLISTFPFRRFRPENRILDDSSSKGKIVIEDDVWIGFGTTILSGVHIGKGAVIAAGAVVTADIPPYAVAGGIPAKVLKNRFGDDVKEVLLELDYDHLTYSDVKANQELFYTPVSKETKAEIVKRLSKLTTSEDYNES